MSRPPYDDTRDIPLTTDSDIEERVGELLGTANQRQMWLIPLDEQDRQLPLLIPIEGMPVRPPRLDDSGLAPALQLLVDEYEVAAFVIVLERYASAELQNSDREWATAMRATCGATGVRLRAVVVLHSDGARLIAPDEYA